MATSTKVIEYPTSDGKPMAETDWHRRVMFDLIEMLAHRYEDDPNTYVSGDLLLFYEEGNRRKHVAPDVFVVFGVVDKERPYYLLWEEGRSPDVIIEVTSKTTRREDQTKKRTLYQDVLKVPEYFQFDPFGDYLKPPLQGLRREGDVYVPIEMVDGRLPSQELGLHLERDGTWLRLYDPATGEYLTTARERAALARDEAREERERTAAARDETREERERADRAEAELRHLRAEIEAARRRNGGS